MVTFTEAVAHVPEAVLVHESCVKKSHSWISQQKTVCRAGNKEDEEMAERQSEQNLKWQYC